MKQKLVAWDKVDKRLVKILLIDFKNKKFYREPTPLGAMGLPFKEATLLQPIGLKDRNGNEVYQMVNIKNLITVKKWETKELSKD